MIKHLTLCNITDCNAWNTPFFNIFYEDERERERECESERDIERETDRHTDRERMIQLIDVLHDMSTNSIP